ncbi:MAG: 7TM diverse intracellular signaling domain-containing protein [Bacteroidia bacterium]
MYSIKRLVLCVLCTGYFISSIYGQYEIQTYSDLEALSLYKEASIYDADQEELSLTEVKDLMRADAFTPLKKESPTLGFTDHHFWVHISIDHLSQYKQAFYLETGRPITDYVDLYLIDEAGQFQLFHSGDESPWEERSFAHRKIIFPLQFEAQSQYELYLHYKSDGEIIDLPLLLKPAALVIGETYSTQFLFGFFFGVLCLAIITYSFFFFALKDSSFLYYCLYVSTTGFLQLSWDGYFYQYLSPSGGYFNQRAVLISALLTACFLGRYTKVLLKTKTFVPRLHICYLVGEVVLAILLFFVLFVPASIPMAYIAANAVGLFILIIALATIVNYYVNGYPIDHFFVVGVSILMVSYVLFILNNLGIFPNSFFSNHIIKIGTGLEVIFLSLTMSRRIRILKSEKEQMQTLALHRSEEMNELKSYYLSNMSHELRTPLNAIMGISEVMIDEVESDEIRKNFETIKSVSIGLLSSVNDVLDFSKIEKGELTLTKTPFSLQSLLHDLSAQSKVQAQFKGIDFAYKYDNPLSQKLLGDSLRLAQVLNNLLTNALKFTAEGNISFSVSHRFREDAKVEINFKIADTGVGISPEKQQTIFEALTQEDITHKRKFGGFGMGLFIVKSLVDLHQGEISLQSELGKGSVFSLLLSYELAPEQAEEVEPIAFDEQKICVTRILVVEDNPINQMVMEAILGKWENTEVYISDNGEEALTFLQDNQVDIILMDLQMPVMDGYEATIAIRKGEAGSHNKDLPILALTADTMESSRKYAREIGMDDYLTKPVAPDFLLLKAGQYLKWNLQIVSQS